MGCNSSTCSELQVLQCFLQLVTAVNPLNYKSLVPRVLTAFVCIVCDIETYHNLTNYQNS